MVTTKEQERLASVLLDAGEKFETSFNSIDIGVEHNHII